MNNPEMNQTESKSVLNNKKLQRGTNLLLYLTGRCLIFNQLETRFDFVSPDSFFSKCIPKTNLNY